MSALLLVALLFQDGLPCPTVECAAAAAMQPIAMVEGRVVAMPEGAPSGDASDGVTVRVIGGAEQVVSSQTTPKVRPFAILEVSGPLGMDSPDGAKLRGFVRLRYTSLPGAQAIDPTAVGTFGALEVDTGLGLRLGKPIVRGEQRITKALYLTAGFATRLPGDTASAQSTANHIATMFRVTEQHSGAYFEVGYSPYHEGAGEDAVQAIVVGGAIPLSGTRGVVVIAGNAVIPMGRTFSNYYTYQGRSRSVVNYGVGIDLGMLFR